VLRDIPGITLTRTGKCTWEATEAQLAYACSYWAIVSDFFSGEGFKSGFFADGPTGEYFNDIGELVVIVE
jgi:hypothetical protein